MRYSMAAVDQFRENARWHREAAVECAEGRAYLDDPDADTPDDHLCMAREDELDARLEAAHLLRGL